MLRVLRVLRLPRPRKYHPRAHPLKFHATKFRRVSSWSHWDMTINVSSCHPHLELPAPYWPFLDHIPKPQYVDHYWRPKTAARNLKNNLPCRGFVKTSANISFVPQCWIDTTPLDTKSLMKKNLISMCLILFPADDRPLTSRSIADLLSCLMIVPLMANPCIF